LELNGEGTNSHVSDAAVIFISNRVSPLLTPCQDSNHIHL